MMTNKNKQLMQTIFAELATGNDAPFINAMADEIKWVWMGSGQWSKTFDGKESVLNELWNAVRQTLVPPFKVNARQFIADGNYVVVEAVGQNTTSDGRKYENMYCWVCCIENEKIQELREYMDTELVTNTFKESTTPA